MSYFVARKRESPSSYSQKKRRRVFLTGEGRKWSPFLSLDRRELLECPNRGLIRPIVMFNIVFALLDTRHCTLLFNVIKGSVFVTRTCIAKSRFKTRVFFLLKIEFDVLSSSLANDLYTSRTNSCFSPSPPNYPCVR